MSIFVSGGRAGCRSFGCTAHNLVCTPTNRLHRREEVEPGPVTSICGAHRMERELPSGCCRGLSTACGPAMVHVGLPESLSEDEGLDLQREPPKRLEPTGVGTREGARGTGGREGLGRGHGGLVWRKMLLDRIIRRIQGQV